MEEEEPAATPEAGAPGAALRKARRAKQPKQRETLGEEAPPFPGVAQAEAPDEVPGGPGRLGG